MKHSWIKVYGIKSLVKNSKYFDLYMHWRCVGGGEDFNIVQPKATWIFNFCFVIWRTVPFSFAFSTNKGYWRPTMCFNFDPLRNLIVIPNYGLNVQFSLRFGFKWINYMRNLCIINEVFSWYSIVCFDRCYLGMIRKWPALTLKYPIALCHSCIPVFYMLIMLLHCIDIMAHIQGMIIQCKTQPRYRRN